MADSFELAADPQAAITACLDDLAAFVPAKDVFAKLRSIEDKVAAGSALRARFLLVRGIANNRLGLRGEALGDLHEARRLVERRADPRGLLDILRAVAVVHTWHGEWGEAMSTMLDAVAESAAAKDWTAIALLLIEAGRLQIEIGRPKRAQFLLTRALSIGGADLRQGERERAEVQLLQALVAAKLPGEARTRLAMTGPWLGDAAPRHKLLVEIENARVAISSNDPAAAKAALARAAAFVPADADSFERVEVEHAAAEVALATGDVARAANLLSNVVSRYADDDLAGREVVARMLQADVFDELGRTNEAERTLAAGLRRAIARGLNGYADQLRSRIAARGGVEGVWQRGETLDVSGLGEVTRRFVRQRPIASGGYGSVERGYDLELGIDVALKRIKLAGLYDVATRDRLLSSAKTEIAAASRIAHPGIARVHGLILDSTGDALLIQELIEGPTLSTATAQPMTITRALNILSLIAQALAAVHAAGVVHRDLNPNNIILRSDGTPVIVDFGIALVGGRQDPGPAGTRDYMAPEQATGRAVDLRADIYSMGVIAYRVLTSSLPDPAPSGFAMVRLPWWRRRTRDAFIAVGLDRKLADLFLQMLTPSRHRRPSSAQAIATQLSAAAGKAGGPKR